MANVLRIVLNGTDENPFHKWGLTRNPFPQIARAEVQAQVMRIQSLGATPIPNAKYIQDHLQGWVSQELIDLCKTQFVPGRAVSFVVTWP